MASGDVVGQVRLLELLGRGFEEITAIVNADIIRRSNAGAGC